MATKLLVADDSTTIQKVVNLTFASEEVQIESAANGDLALERAHAIRPDIVLADVIMPGMNGYQLCAAIKSDPELAQTPVVLLVGTFEPFDELEAARVKCDGYLTKPFDTSELVQVVHRLAGRLHSEPVAAEAAVPLPERAVLNAIAGSIGRETASGALVSERARESFLGLGRILELFETAAPKLPQCDGVKQGSAGAARIPELPRTESHPPVASSQVIRFPGTRSAGSDDVPITLSDEMVNHIVEKVVKRMSHDVVREIAWEVVPELSEKMIRQLLDELNLPAKK